MTLWARPGIKWEQDLERGATVLHPVADIGQEWRELSQASPQSRTDFDGRLREIATQLAHVLGRPIEPVPAAVARALAEMDLILIPRAVNSLESALSRYPDQWKVSREISRLHLRSASLLWSRHQEAGAREQFEKSARAATPQGPNAGIAAAWGALGFVHHTEAEVTGEIRPLSRAALAWEEGAALDPYSLEYPVRLMKAYEDLGRLDEARAWARKVLDVDALQRLDQSVRGLNDSDRGRALRLLEKP
jgi:tetratricopeptide (TPR) repeat protein